MADIQQQFIHFGGIAAATSVSKLLRMSTGARCAKTGTERGHAITRRASAGTQ